MPSIRQFAWSARILHWLMAVMVLAMLFIGVAMVTSLADYHLLLSIHRPLGIMILVLVVARFINRQLNPLPPFPSTMSSSERFAATWSERLMYGLMFAVPLIGWAMLSAARFPIVLYGPIRLPPILPVNTALFTVLRRAHTVLAYLFFFTVIAHLTAVLFHTLVIRDRLIERMVPWRLGAIATPKPGAPVASDPT
jgi:cytochrome b561